MSVTQKEAIFCYIKPKMISHEKDLKIPTQNKRLSNSSQLLNDMNKAEDLTWGQAIDPVVKKWATEKFMDKSYNEEGVLTIVINIVEKVKQNDDDDEESSNSEEN